MTDSEEKLGEENQKSLEDKILEDQKEAAEGFNPDNIFLSSKIRWIIFTVLTLVATVSSFDGGIIPAAPDEMKKEMGGVNDTWFGVFGSSDYLGRLIGSVIFVLIINKINRQFVLVLTLFFKAVTLSICYLTQNFWAILVGRSISGFSQVFYTIYLPVWCDQYGSKKARTMMVTIVQVGNPLGIVFGFGICTLLSSNWKASFAIEAGVLCLLGIIILIFPKKYFTNTLAIFEENEGPSEKPKTNDKEVVDISENANNNDNVSQTTSTTEKPASLVENLKNIITEPVFICTTLANSVVFFGMSAVQYWGADYMDKVLNVEDPKMRMMVFSIVSITGPTLGVIMGGVAGSIAGGYVNKKAIFICLGFDILACASAVPVGYFDKLIYFAIALWLFFFFSGTLIPLETGIILASLPPKARGDGLSFSSFLLNLFGNLPCAFVYGIINNYSYPTHKKLAMNVVMYYSFAGTILIIFSTIFRLRKPEVMDNGSYETHANIKDKLEQDFGKGESDISNNNEIVPNSHVTISE